MIDLRLLFWTEYLTDSMNYKATEHIQNISVIIDYRVRSIIAEMVKNQKQILFSNKSGCYFVVILVQCHELGESNIPPPDKGVIL